MFKKEKSIIRLCRVINGLPHFLKSIKLKTETSDIIRYNKRSYAIKREEPTYKIKNLTVYCLDIDTMDILALNNEKDVIEVNVLPFKIIASAMSPEELDILINRKIVSQITSDLNESTFSVEAKNMVLGAIMGAGIVGFVIMILLYVGVF